VTIFWPICDHDGCLRREATAVTDLLNPRRAFESATPRDGVFVYLTRGSGVWGFACDVHHGDTRGSFAVLELRRVRSDVEGSRQAPAWCGVTNWSFVHRLITEGITVPETPAALQGLASAGVAQVSTGSPIMAETPTRLVSVPVLDYVSHDVEVPLPDEAPPLDDWLV
jgi:hypothetical protein